MGFGTSLAIARLILTDLYELRKSSKHVNSVVLELIRNSDMFFLWFRTTVQAKFSAENETQPEAVFVHFVLFLFLSCLPH
jgi:hypothetical protein